MFDLSGQVAMITGASSGLGWAFAKILAEAGARVVLTARRVDRLKRLCAEIDSVGGSAIHFAMDVGDQASVAAAFDAAEQRFGSVTVLVNNAGISREGYLLELAEQDWDAVVDINLKSVWVVAREAAARMGTTGTGGSIINISSVLSFASSKKLGVYMAAKAGVNQLTRAMALEWAPQNIRVNAIAPGYFPTEMTGDFFTTPQGKEMLHRIPQRRTGELNELAGPLLLLASSASSYMTGSIVVVDGGFLSMSM